MSNISSNNSSVISLQEEQWMLFMGRDIFAFMYLFIVSTVGTFGNSITFWIYLMRFKSSTNRALLLCLTMTDLTMCLIGIPFVMASLRHSYTFYSNAACKFYIFLSFFLATYSWLLLDIIAVERYTNICRPTHRPWRVRKILLVCLLFAMIDMSLLAVPSFILYGVTEVITDEHGLTGQRCTVLKTWKHSTMTNVVHGSAAFFMLAGFLFCIVLYGLISKTLASHGHLLRIPLSISAREGMFSIYSDTEFETAKSSLETDNGSTNKDVENSNVACNESRNLERVSSNVRLGQKDDSGRMKDTGNQKTKRRQPQNAMYIRSLQITRMLMVTSGLSCVFSLAFAIIFIWFSFDTQSAERHKVALPIVKGLLLLNHATNPMVYCVFDSRLRQEWKKLYAAWKRKICKCK